MIRQSTTLGSLGLFLFARSSCFIIFPLNKNIEWRLLSLQQAYNDLVGGPLDIADIMDTWTKQMGFPVVNVERDMNDLVLNQDWFLVDPNANRSAAPFESPYE